MRFEGFVRGGNTFEAACKRGDDPDFFEQGRDQVVFGGEVVVQGGFGDTDALGEGGEGGPVDAFLGDQVVCVGEDFAQRIGVAFNRSLQSASSTGRSVDEA